MRVRMAEANAFMADSMLCGAWRRGCVHLAEVYKGHCARLATGVVVSDDVRACPYN